MDLKQATFLSAEAAHFALSTLHELLEAESDKEHVAKAIEILNPVWTSALKENGA